MEASSIKAFMRGIRLLNGLHPDSDFWQGDNNEGNGAKLIFIVFTDFSPNVKKEVKQKKKSKYNFG